MPFATLHPHFFFVPLTNSDQNRSPSSLILPRRFFTLRLPLPTFICGPSMPSLAVVVSFHPRAHSILVCCPCHSYVALVFFLFADFSLIPYLYTLQVSIAPIPSESLEDNEKTKREGVKVVLAHTRIDEWWWLWKKKNDNRGTTDRWYDVFCLMFVKHCVPNNCVVPSGTSKNNAAVH